MDIPESEGPAMAIKDMKLDELMSELRGEATKRAGDLLGEGRSQVRRAVGGHDDGAILGTFAIGLIVGAIVGAALALLLTPFSGDEARRRLGRRVEEMRASDDWQRTGNGQPAGVGSAQTAYPGTPGAQP
ncbi:MAG TPA: YtxH domain-containing protein [Candidatus Limnocylindrales bacterium]|nr:YtxH domain-containing protein [Candidatus Limnocylindrales bacterium]